MSESHTFHDRRPYTLGKTRAVKGTYFADVIDRFEAPVATVQNRLSIESVKKSAERMAEVFNEIYANAPK